VFLLEKRWNKGGFDQRGLVSPPPGGKACLRAESRKIKENCGTKKRDSGAVLGGALAQSCQTAKIRYIEKKFGEKRGQSAE